MADETKIVGLKVGVDTGSSATEVNRLKDASNDLLGGLGQLEKGTHSASRGFNDFGSVMGTVKAAIAGVGIVALIRDVTKAANELDRANVGLAVTARYAGAGMEEAQKAAASLAKDGLMTVADASRSLQNLLSRGFSLEESVKMMDRFKDSAAFNRQASLDFGEAIKGATEGLKNENSMLVDNAGVTKNVSVMWKEYAAQIGTTADKLTQAQKRQAEYNGIMRETEGQVGNAALMVDTFAGAQARATQQTTELKQTLGIALQPALQGILTIMGPLVTGLRDMIYWVETLGARSGGVYDKIRARLEERFSLPKEGQAMGLKGIHERIAARDAEIDRNVDAVIADIVARSTGSTLPNVGKDSGARRKDTIIPDKPAKDTDATDQLWNGYLSGLKGFNDQIRQLNPDLTDFQKKSQAIDDTLAQQLEKFKGFENNPGVQRYVESLKTAADHAKQNLALDYNLQGNEMTPRQQYQFDDAARLSKWEAVRADYDRKEEQDQFNHLQTMAGIESGIDQLRLQHKTEYQSGLWGIQTAGFAEETAILQAKYNEDRRLAEEQLMWTLSTTAMEESEKDRIRGEYRAKEKAAEQRLAADKYAIKQRHEQQVSSLQMSALNQGVGLLQTLANHNKAAAIASIAVQKGLAIAQTFVSTKAAALRAMAELGPIAGTPVAASIEAWGAVNMALIAATGITDMAGATGQTGGAGGTGGGTNSSPVVTQPSVATQQQQVVINIHGAIGERRWFEDNLPTILQDFASRNVSTGVVYA